jgi:adenine-specific DNA-methyltransferase
MNSAAKASPAITKRRRRYQVVTQEKAGGATYTPGSLADFVASHILAAAQLPKNGRIRILDPAVGDGELLLRLLAKMPERILANVEVHGFETDEGALRRATARLRQQYPSALLRLKLESFLEFVLKRTMDAHSLFGTTHDDGFDLIIANPPYVRTQVMGAAQAQLLARQFDLGGRVDLYHAFLLGMSEVLAPHGTAGVIVSNRFMTTKSGAPVRQALRKVFDIDHVWDLGDTKLFDVAVLPAVILVHGRNGRQTHTPKFTSIYETIRPAAAQASNPLAAVLEQGTIGVADGRRFEVRHGELDSRGSLDEVWRIATEAGDAWLARVEAKKWGTFRTIGKIRVGVKTCADQVFIRDDWHLLPAEMQPELLRPLVTHHTGRRFKASVSGKPRKILYPHEIMDGGRIASDLDKNPRTKAYLESHRNVLEARRYVTDGGRKWYEIWVPQDPAAWDAPKLVFRDISERPMFWIDRDGSVVNGDCYWLTADRRRDAELLWLAVAVGNSQFIEAFYDHRFHNKLYSGRRRFMTQYVEQFPLPDPASKIGKAIISRAEALYASFDGDNTNEMEAELNELVLEAFGLSVEEIGR